MLAIEIEGEYRSVARSLSGWGPKGEPSDSITAGSEVVDFLRMLKLILQLDSSISAIEVEPEYRSISRSLSRWGSKGESNALITTERETTDFLRRRRSCNYSFGMLWNIKILN
jgi:hypothetical protein